MILSIDPSLKESGYAVVGATDETYVIEASGYISTDQKMTDGQRLKVIYKKLNEIISWYQLIFEIAIEVPFVGQNRKTALQLGAVRGIILLLAADWRLNIFEYSPLAVKAALGFGHADKIGVANMVKMLTGIDSNNNNITDAIAIGICHILKQKERELCPRK